jgi:hypothetical protein
MLSAIEQATLTKITTTLEDVRAAGIQRDARGLYVGPTVEVAILGRSFSRVTAEAFRQEATVSVLIGVTNQKGEAPRRESVNALIEGIIGLLLLETFELEIRPLTPKSFREVSDDDDVREGKILYLLEFVTSFVVVKPNAEMLTDLLSVGVNYYLKPGDDLVDASDPISLGD